LNVCLRVPWGKKPTSTARGTAERWKKKKGVPVNKNAARERKTPGNQRKRG